VIMNTAALSLARLMMIAVSSGWFWGVAAVLATPQAFAESGHQEKLIASKLKLLESMLIDSSVSRRIESSGDEESKRQLFDARAALASAQLDLKDGRYNEAEDAINKGLRSLSVAAQGVTDITRKGSIEKQRYMQLRGQIMSYRDAVKNILSEIGGARRPSVDMEAINELVLSADGLANEGRYADANTLLGRANSELEVAMISMRANQTLVHKLEFATPAEEYAYEQQRNRAQVMLIDMLREQRELNPAARSQIEKIVNENRIALAQAEKMVAEDRTKEAIGRLEQATAKLDTALRLAGVPVP